MKDFIKKYWVSGLGISFLFLALLYFLRLAVDNGWFPIELRIALASLLGIVGLFSGFLLYKKGSTTLAQVVGGIGAAILYATVGFISFTDVLQWSNGALLISMIGISFLTSGVAVRYSLRILFSISLIGGLMTPFVIQASSAMDLPLFIYVLLLAIAALYVAISKGWKENMLIAFLMSLGLFSSYYFFFDPNNWERPFFYVSTLFGLFMSGFMFSSIREKNYDGIELLFGAINGLNFIFWSYWIFSDYSLPYILPFLIVGAVFMALGFIVYYKSDKTAKTAFGAYVALGLMLLGIAGNDLGLLYQNGGIEYVITATVWLLIIGVVKILGIRLKDDQIFYFSFMGFLLLLFYWFSAAWKVDWIPMFGAKYIPFINPGALIWAGLAFLGFMYSNHIKRSQNDPLGFSKSNVSAVVALISHVVIGGLLTIQIMNLWDAYDIRFIDQDLSLSLCWFVYALILTLWANYSNHSSFKVFGSVVILVASFKVVAWDIAGNSSLQKILFLLLLGGITLFIGYIRKKAKNPVKPID